MRRTRRQKIPVRRPTGLYVHSNPPTVLPVNPSILRQWLRGGEIERLTEMVLDGEGHRLLGEYSPEPRSRAFLRTIPTALVRIDMAHEAVDKGDLRELEVMLESGAGQRVRVELSRDPVFGLGLMHKAILHDHPNILNFLLQKYPATIHVTDKAHRTPLHYVAGCSEPGDTWKRLLEAGADPSVVDTSGYTAAFYMNHPRQISVPRQELPHRKTSVSQRGLMLLKPANIRIWIHDRDLGRLQEIVWEGYGDRLRSETSSHPLVRRFLNAVPYIMGTIKEVHMAAVTNDLELLNRRISPPVPKDILRSKDGNGLTPLHKAVGLGHFEMAKEMASKAPNALRATDPQGRTVLHYAATLKNQEEMFEMLVASGLSPDIKDNKGNVAEYYKGRHSDIDPKLLKVIPEAPRTAHIYPPSWDWRLLHGNDEQVADTPSNADSAFEDASPEVFTEQKTGSAEVDDGTEDEGVGVEMALPADEPQTSDVNGMSETSPSKSSGGGSSIEVGSSSPAKPTQVNDNDDISEDAANPGEGRIDHAKNDEVMPDSLDGSEYAEGPESADQKASGTWAVELGDDGDDEATDDERSSIVTYIKDNEDETNLAEDGDDWNESDKREDEAGENTDGGDLIEKVDEIVGEVVPLEPNVTGGTGGEPIQEMVESGNMEKMAELVLEGDGHLLLGHVSRNPDVQLFLNNVPQYMAKIETVHKAAREGDLRTVQAALDRRKFAVAKDNSTPLKATPLHVATLFGRTSVLRYLAGRFPETMHSQDSQGRTPLHYAATLPDNGHFYSLLVTLGADRSVTDNEGNSAEHYLRNPGQLTHLSLMSEYQGRSNKLSGFNVNQYSDKVSNDTVSSRRDLDDEIILEQLEKCFKLIHNNKGNVTLLQRFLSEKTFDELKFRCTKNNNTLIDVIRPGVKSIVLGSNKPDSQCGEIFIPDAESFRVFPEIIMPIVKISNGMDHRVLLDPHPDSTFFESEKQRVVIDDLDLDPTGHIVKNCVIECSRNLSHVPFSKNLKLSDLEKVEGALSTLLTMYYMDSSIGYVDDAGSNNGVYYSINEIIDNTDIFQELQEENLLVQGIDESETQEWQYGKGVFISPLGEVTAWINIQDHIKILSSTLEDKRGFIGAAYKNLAQIVEHLENKLEFARDLQLGYLTTNPSLVGTAVKFSALLSLPHTSESKPSIEEMCRSQSLIMEKMSSPGLYKFQNKTCLGVTEIESLKHFIASISAIIDVEKKYIKNSVVHIPNMIKRFLRKKNKKRC